MFKCSHPDFVMIKYNLTLVNFLAEHCQQHIVVGGKLLMNPGSLQQSAENLQQLNERRTPRFQICSFASCSG